MPAAEEKPAVVNLNTIMLAVVLGVLSWIGITTQNTSVAIAVIAEKTAGIAEKNSVQEREILALRSRMADVELAIERFKRSRE